MTITNHFLLDWKIFLVSFGFLSATLTINIKTPILPVGNLTFILLALCIWFVSMCATFIGLHKLLQQKEPISPSFLNEYLKFLAVSKPTTSAKLTFKLNPESIKRLTLDIDKYFISKWYCSISINPDFPDESKIFLQEVLTRLVDIVLQVNHKCVLHGILNIYLKHLKEFRRSLKRKEKYNIAIEELYRYSHVCSTSSIKKTKDYFLHQLTASLLRHFINSELWNSLPCHILVSVLARKFICHLLSMLSNPEVLNYIILNSLASNDIKEKLNLGEYGRISVTEFFDVVDKVKIGDIEQSKQTNEQQNQDIESNVDIKHEVNKLEMKVIEASKQQKKDKEQQKDSLSIQVYIPGEKVVLRHKKRHHIETDGHHSADKSPKRSDPVKIYESKNTVRTWRDSRDLACVSLGQDPLDALHLTPDSGGKISAKPVLWDSTTAMKSDDAKHDSPTSATHLFNEVMHITSMEGLKSSIKPISEATERTLHNIKDLQETTVHNALHKIGDFQVTDTEKKQIENLNYLHYLPPHTLLHSSVLSNTQRLLHAQPEDEAAGVVEGLLDFGRAGFRKGLRLTGLQDNIENAKATFSNNTSTAKTVTKSVKEQVKKKLEELKKSDSDSQEKMSSADSADSVWINPLQTDSPIYDGQILLEKCPKKNDVDLTNNAPRIEDLPIPSISTEQPSGTESPDIEYEDTADLASSIAKLRCLLQQRSSESSLSTPALSPMPDEYIQKQVESENASDVEALEVDGVMPSFYKFCTKTASGVLSNTINTIKTALPGNSAEHVFAIEKWKFKSDQQDSGFEDSPSLEIACLTCFVLENVRKKLISKMLLLETVYGESDTFIRMKKLLTERKEYCILDKEIDTAYDALDSVDIFQQSPVLLSNLHFEDELDDFEGKIPTTKVLVDIVCELLEDTNSSLIQEPIVKAIVLAFGSTIEDKVETQISNVMEYLAENLVTIPEKTNTNVLSMEIDEYIESIHSSFPDLLKYFFGRENFKHALKLFVSSIQEKQINEDSLLQVFELVAMKIIEESSAHISPPASA